MIKQMTFVHLCQIWPQFGVMVYDAADHFLADLDFLGVLTPPFFLGVLKFLSQTSHTQRPVGMESMPTQNVWYPLSHLSQNIISSSWWGCWHTVQVLHSIHCQWYVWITRTSSSLMSRQDGWPLLSHWEQ